jgi:UDPglucose--hexose-1-phosphate uridylyltransferase
MSEIRYSKFDNKYVIIAPERFHKPNKLESTNNFEVEHCPFCKGNESMTTKDICGMKDSNGEWLTRVIPNLYTALNLDTKNESIKTGMFEKFNGFGVHEVVIDTNQHKSIFEFTKNDYFYLLKTIKSRVMDLKKDSRIKYLSIFKNNGLKAGASQPHPHTQIIGLPILPIDKKEKLEREYRYYKHHGRKLLQDIVSEEVKEDRRILLKNREFTSFMPYASLFPFEIMIVPNEDFYSITHMEDSILEELATILNKSLTLLNRELGEFDFNVEFAEPPINKNFDSEEFYSSLENISMFYIRISPRIFNLAGFEISNEMNINPVEPEFAIKVLNESIY